MLPQTLALCSPLIVEGGTAFFLHQTHPFAAFCNNDQPQLGIDFTFTVPVTAGRANLYFSGQNQF